VDASRRHRDEARVTSLIGPTPVSHKGVTNEWYTPPEIIEPIVAAMRHFGLQLALDPASPPGGLDWIPALITYDHEDDGLVQPWFGFVWLNPPFGRETVKWMRKMAEHGEGIALVAARMNTRWWHETVVPHAYSFCMLTKRPYFHDSQLERASFNSGGDIVLVAYGEDAHHVLARSCLGGMARLRA
jgi:hypothetical protein